MLEIEQANAYELPASYDDNRVVLMAKDPHWLFAYWDLDPALEDAFRLEFGNEVWNRSVPYLKVRNITMNKEFHIRINDFSSSWYISVPEPDCFYTVEVGRKSSERFFISLAGSNIAGTPRDSISNNSRTIFVNCRKPDTAAHTDFMANYSETGALPYKYVNNNPSSIEVFSSDIFETLVSSEGIYDK